MHPSLQAMCAIGTTKDRPKVTGAQVMLNRELYPCWWLAELWSSLSVIQPSFHSGMGSANSLSLDNLFHLEAHS